jgi:hypothetical protein
MLDPGLPCAHLGDFLVGLCWFSIVYSIGFLLGTGINGWFSIVYSMFMLVFSGDWPGFFDV